MSKTAEVDQVVSAVAWAKFPALLVGVMKWAELAGPEAADLAVSAFPLGMDWISVRVTRLGADDRRPADWIEWLMPMGFFGATEAAVDHYVARSMAEAAGKLSRRDGQLRGVADFPPVPVVPESESGAETVAKSKQQQPAPAPTPAKRAAPKKPAAGKSKPPAAPRAEARSGPAAPAARSEPRAEEKPAAKKPAAKKPAARPGAK